MTTSTISDEGGKNCIAAGLGIIRVFALGLDTSLWHLGDDSVGLHDFLAALLVFTASLDALLGWLLVVSFLGVILLGSGGLLLLGWEFHTESLHDIVAALSILATGINAFLRGLLCLLSIALILLCSLVFLLLWRRHLHTKGLHHVMAAFPVCATSVDALLRWALLLWLISIAVLEGSESYGVSENTSGGKGNESIHGKDIFVFSI